MSFGSVVRMFCCLISYTDSWMKLSWPGGWYLTPASTCLPVEGSNGLWWMSAPVTGRNDSV
ncbi:hypothetical protein D3C80_2039700 [compost metagenome]